MKDASENPYEYRSDETLETFVCGVVDDAIANATTSPRDVGFYSKDAARRIAQYVLERYARKSSGV